MLEGAKEGGGEGKGGGKHKRLLPSPSSGSGHLRDGREQPELPGGERCPLVSLGQPVTAPRGGTQGRRWYHEELLNVGFRTG